MVITGVVDQCHLHSRKGRLFYDRRWFSSLHGFAGIDIADMVIAEAVHISISPPDFSVGSSPRSVRATPFADVVVTTRHH
jgi:hypothetical protein